MALLTSDFILTIGRPARRGIALAAGLSAAILSKLAASAALPAACITGVVKAAPWFATRPTSGNASVPTAAILAEVGLNGMALARSKLVLVLLLPLSFPAGVGHCAYQEVAEKQAAAQAIVPQPVILDHGEAKPAAAIQAPVDQLGDSLPAEAIARLGTIRLRHGAPVQGLAFAPDGKSLASAGNDGTVHIWETATGKELLRVENERIRTLGFGMITAITFAPDGRFLAGARINQQPCLWDVATGKEIRQFGGKNNRAQWIVFSPDGKRLAYGGSREDQDVRLVDANTGKDLFKFGKYKGHMTQIVFSPDKKTLVSADDQGLLFFEIAAGQVRELPRPEAQEGRFWSFAFSRDGKSLAAVKNGSELVLVEVPSGKILRSIMMDAKKAEVSRVVISLDGTTLISGHKDGFVRFWDVASGAKKTEFRAHLYSVWQIALSPDGKTLATSAYGSDLGEHTVRLWEAKTGKPLLDNPGPRAGIARIVFSPDGKRVATASWGGVVHLWESSTGKMLWRASVFGPLAFTPDGQALVCAGWSDGKVRVLDSTTGKEIRQFSADAKGIHDSALSHDGKVLATSGGDGCLRLWDLATGRSFQDFGGKQKAFIQRFVLSLDAKLIAALHQGNAIRLWDATTGKLVREHVEPALVGGIAFSPDGKILASTLAPGLKTPPMIRLRDVATGKEIRQLKGYDISISLGEIAFSQDGRSLIWGGPQHRDMILWEVATGQLRRKFSGHQGQLTCVTFSPDGRMMASGSTDASALIWDASGQRRRLQPHTPLSAAELDKLWTDLAAEDAALAYQAICTLRASPRQAVTHFEKHLKPVPHADAKQVANALRNLGSDQFTVRTKAVKALEALGEGAEPALRKALAGASSVEFRRRVNQLLDRLVGAESLRRARALEALENVGDSDSHRLLAALANGAPHTRLTEEARAALDRLRRHAPSDSK